MKRTAARLGMVTLLVMWVTIPVGAQELEQGTWTGTLTPPPGVEVPVTFEVGGTDGTPFYRHDCAPWWSRPWCLMT